MQKSLGAIWAEAGSQAFKRILGPGLPPRNGNHVFCSSLSGVVDIRPDG